MVPRKRGDDSRRVLPWALLLSILAHAVVIPILLWLVVARYLTPTLKPPEQLSLTSTDVTIAHRNATVPNHRAKPQPVVQQPQPTVHQTPAPPPPRELAQEAPRAPIQAPPQPHKASLGDQIAAQEQVFAREAQQLHAQSNPLNVPTEAPLAATTYKHSYFDDPAYQRRIQGGYAELESTEQWYDGNLSCHYAHYDLSYNAGGSEDGTIPWPICYPRNHDLMMIPGRRYLPVIGPQPGYVLPSGTDLTPFLKWAYANAPP
jgi:hypothetical protein